MEASYNPIRFSNIVLSCISEKGLDCKFDSVHEHTLMYVISGDMVVEDRDGQHHVKPGECAFIRRNKQAVMHKRSLSDGTPYKSVAIAFPRKYLMEFFNGMDKKNLPSNAHRNNAAIVALPSTVEFSSLFASITPFFESNIVPDDTWIKMKLREALYAMLKADKNLYASLFDFTEPWKIDILDYLNENYMYELSLSDIAHYTGRSLATLKRDFKKVSNLTPQKWITTKRLEKARELLRSGTDKVQDVMVDVGFNNLSHFSRIYKETYGYPPTSERIYNQSV